MLARVQRYLQLDHRTARRSVWHTILRRVREETGLPMLLATRDLETCFELADNMLLLDAGRLLQSGPPRKVLDQPASVEAARLLSASAICSPPKILALDPGRNTSRLRMEAFELAGPYFPGHLLGDRVWLCVQPGELRVAPHTMDRSRNPTKSPCAWSAPWKCRGPCAWSLRAPWWPIWPAPASSFRCLIWIIKSGGWSFHRRRCGCCDHAFEELR